MRAGRTLNLPNTLTVIRVVLIPLFITALDYKRYGYALGLFVVAALTDLFDGLLARARDQKTPLGAFLDPLADKFMLVTSFVFFTYYGWLPAWLTIIVISRDVIVVTGFVVLFLLHLTPKVQPLPSGKLAIAFQFALLSYVLLDINFGLPGAIKGPAVFLTAAASVYSGLRYVGRELRVFKHPEGK